MQTVGSIGFGPHPDVGVVPDRDPSGQWVHTTLWDLPAHTRINVTVYQYDSGSPLRNQQLGQVIGTIGTVATYNGKPESVIDSNDTNGVGHTFTIPTLGISVPLIGDLTRRQESVQCRALHLQLRPQRVKFSFMTPGPGQYPWQCFVPCGLGYLYGNGGPMQTVGYMDGFLKVVA